MWLYVYLCVRGEGVVYRKDRILNRMEAKYCFTIFQADKQILSPYFPNKQRQKYRGAWGVAPPTYKIAQFPGQLNLFAGQ